MRLDSSSKTIEQILKTSLVETNIEKCESWKTPFAELLDGTKIYIVDGTYIRNHFYIDFVLGGHGYVYDFIPKNEIWVEQVKNNIDERHNLTHEIIEYLLMKHTDQDYENAHEFSAKAEDILRKFQTNKSLINAAKFFYVPHVRQNTNYTCGAASISSILAYYGIDVRESEIAEQTDADPEEGIAPEQLSDYLKKQNLKAPIEKMDVKELKEYISKDIPVIIELQAWGKVKDYADDFKNGHYVVCIGYDEDGFYFMDPAQWGYSYLVSSDLESRWHDIDNGKVNKNLGIPVYGKKPEFKLTETNEIK